EGRAGSLLRPVLLLPEHPRRPAPGPARLADRQALRLAGGDPDAPVRCPRRIWAGGHERRARGDLEREAPGERPRLLAHENGPATAVAAHAPGREGQGQGDG